MNPQRLLIVHPDPSTRSLLSSMLRTLGHRIEEAENDRVAARLLERGPFDLVLVGFEDKNCGGDLDTLELLAYVRRKFAGTPVLLLCAEPRSERVREAVLRGARSVLRYPIAAAQLRAAVSQAMDLAEARGSEEPSTNGVHDPTVPDSTDGAANGTLDQGAEGGALAAPVASPREELIGADPTLKQALELAEAIATSRAPVLIVGERGTGKRLLARRLHGLSPRRTRPFIEVSCSGQREGTLELELFGSRGGEPSGADRAGRVAQADGGTIFLDDVAALPAALQYKLLRLLRDGEYEPVGSTQTERADCRIVVTSREDLASLVADERFRPDLFYALSVVTLKVPPLRHRGSDIARLANHFATRFARDSGKANVRLLPEALRALEAHNWPGNVHELRAAVERAVLFSRGGPIGPEHLDLSPREPLVHRNDVVATRRVRAHDLVPLKEALEEPERQIILNALQALNWNRQETARVLDINRTTLYKKMKKYGLIFDEPVWTN